MNRRDFLVRSATLIGACLLPMPEVAGLTTEKIRSAKVALDGQTAYLELAKHFKYEIIFVPEKTCHLATLTGKLQDKEQADWTAAEYIEEASQFGEIVETLERAMARKYVEIAHRDN